MTRDTSSLQRYLHLRESCLRGWRHCAVREGGRPLAPHLRDLAGAGAAYTFGSLLVNLSIYRGVYSTGSLYDLPIIASLLWLGTAGVTAYSSGSEHLQARPRRRRRNRPEARRAAKPSGRRAWRERHCFRFLSSASGV